MRSGAIIKSAIYVSFITFFIKVLGLIKQSVIAAKCGAGIDIDSFFIATGILVQLCTVIFSSISVSLLTIHTGVLVNEGRKKSNLLINEVLRVFLPIAATISLLFAVFAPQFAKAFAPTYSIIESTILTRHIRLMSISFVFWCYYLIINVVLETDKRFLPGKGQNLFQNIFLIITPILFYDKYGADALVVAFLLSGFIQCINVTWCARKIFKFTFDRIDCKDKIGTLIKISIPLIVGNAIYEINDIVDKQITSGLGAGNIAVLTYGGSINEIVTGIVIMSVATVLFSHFSTWVEEKQDSKVCSNYITCVKTLIILLVPATVLCVFCRESIVSILYQRGKFGNREVELTALVVLGYALGFVFQAVRAVTVRVYYAYKDTKIPMINGAIAVSLNILLSLLLSRFLGVCGVALATSISMLIVTILLLLGVKRYLLDFTIKQIIPEAIKALIAGSLCAIAIYALCDINFSSRYFELMLKTIICVVVYLISLIILKAESIKTFQNFINQVLHKG